MGGADLATAMSSADAFEIERADPADWRRRVHAGERPHFVLVEGSDWEAEGQLSELDALLADCASAGVPRLLWVTASPLDPRWLARCDSFDRVFTIDLAHIRALIDAGAPIPSVLWPATSVAAHDREASASRGERPYPVVWLGGWNPGWPQEWRDRLAAVLHGAGQHGLAIFPAEEMAGLPDDLRPYVRPPGQPEPDCILSQARVVIGADARVGSPGIAPAVVFDAIASSATVITPHTFQHIGAFTVGDGPTGQVIPFAQGADEAAGWIGRLLENRMVHDGMVAWGRQIVAYNHTYAHRLATLASAAGFRRIPV